MPIVLLPTPQRVHITRENFALGQAVRLAVPPETDRNDVDLLRQELEELFPELELDRDGDASSATLRFTYYKEGQQPEEAPEGVRAESFRLRVRPQGVEVEAASLTGWLLATRLLRGLREGDELVGIELLDWPAFTVRQVDLPWPVDTLSEAVLRRWLGVLALGRFNRIGLLPSADGQPLPNSLRDVAERLGITVGEPVETPTFSLLEQPTLFPPYSVRLPALHEAVRTAAASGHESFVLLLGPADAQTSVEALVYGVMFAGDCAWNPLKADLKAFRRWYAARQFGIDSRALVQTVDELEAATALLTGPGGMDLSAAVEAEDPFDAPLFSGILRPEERAEEVGRRAAAGLAALGPLQPDTEERVNALLGLQWSAQRLRMLSRRLSTAEKVRELYHSAYVAAASPKALSQRLLRAAEILDSEAGALDQHRVEWHALWRRERVGPHDHETELAHRARVAAFRERAERLREVRNRYIQTGVLPTPAEEGLERTGTRLAAGLQPARLPPQPSPAWWPEGGAARMRVEVDCPEAAVGIPWEVQADFRALAGEAGAFNVRSARLLPLTETDKAGSERPCQLLRSGFAFIAEPGLQTYFLYLDPQPGPDSGFRETRATQSRSGARLENRRLRLRLSAAHGFVSSLRLLEPDLELLETEEELEEDAPAPASGWRLRVLETGPLLARVRAEHEDGRIRQLDLAAGQSWTELSVNAPWSEFLLPGRSELWTEAAVVLFGVGDKVERWHLTRAAAEVADVQWVAQHRPDGLTLAALLPEAPAHATAAADGLRMWGGAHVGRVLLFAGIEAEPETAFARLLAAHQELPQVRLGIIEERRVREF